MLSLRHSAWLITVGVLVACAIAAHSDDLVSCRRDALSGPLLWLRGKSTELLKNAESRPGATNPDLGSCLVNNDQPRQTYGQRF